MRVADFFALDTRWVRVPSSDAGRRDATIALCLFAVSAVGLEMLRSGGGLRNDTPVWLEYLGIAAMGVIRGLVEEEVVDDDAFHRRERRHHVRGVGIGLQDVLALHVDAHAAIVNAYRLVSEIDRSENAIEAVPKPGFRVLEGVGRASLRQNMRRRPVAGQA